MENSEEINDFLNECDNMLVHINMLETIEKFTNSFEKAIKQNTGNSVKMKQLHNLVKQFNMLLKQFIEEEN